MKTLLMTVGLPQSGKSTWAREEGLPIVNPDSIRLAIHGQPFIGSAEPFVWATARAMVKSLFLVGHDRVILDATNTTKKRRAEWKSKDWIRSYREFTTDKETCLSRAYLSTRDPNHLKGLRDAIERMAEQFEPIEDEDRDL